MDLRKVFYENIGIKLVSLVLSLSLWFYVTSKGRAEVTVTAPLELRNIPNGMAVTGDVPKNIEVRLQGQERALRDIAWEKRVSGIVDLSRASAGENVLRLSADDIKRPSGVSVTHISPYEIRVRLEPVTRKSFRLNARLKGNPADGYVVSGIYATPPRLTVEGPQSAVNSLGPLQTMPIDISGANRNVTITQPRIDYRGKPVRILEKDIVIRILIEKMEKEVK